MPALAGVVTPFEFIVIAAAAWRLASLLVSEDGPFEVFAAVRALVGIPRPGDMAVRQVPVLAGILSCVWCAGLWCSVGVWAFWDYVGHLPVELMAIAATVCLIEALVRS